MKSVTWNLFGAVVCLALVSGCTPPGMIIGMTSKMKENVTSDTLVLPSRPRDFVGGASAAGESLKYDVAGVDRANSAVRFTQKTSMIESTLIGPNRSISLEVSLGADGRTVSLQMIFIGNMGSAAQDKVNERMEKFKAALLEGLS